MDCSRIFWLGVWALVSIGCGGQKTVSSVFPEKSDECSQRSHPQRFIVHWEDGRRTLERAASADEFRQNFISANLQKIEFVEHDEIVLAKSPLVLETRFNQPMVSWGPQLVKADSAWQRSIRGANVVVAVIDSGVDREHLQLRDNLAINSGETGTDASGEDRRYNGIDDDNNGFVDDWAGYDFFDRTGKVEDTSAHGTHVAGIIAARHNDLNFDSTKMQGIAPAAKILPLDFISGEGGFISDAIDAIDYARLRGAKVINASWGGGGCSLSLRRAISDLNTAGILFVVAAGNESTNIDINKKYPASDLFFNQITVGSITPMGDMASHSNYGEVAVQLFAPGDEILSTTPFDTYSVFSGTSMATPFVAGAAALLWSHRPDANLAEVRSALLNSVFRRNDYRNSTRGRLDISAAIDALN